MNSEQTKLLNPGDTIFIRAYFIKTDDGGNVIFSCKYNCGGIVNLTNYVRIEDAFPRYTLQNPQPDESITGSEHPHSAGCRRFRVGDIVAPKARDGREVPDGAPVGEKCTVVEAEKNGIVCIRYDAGSEHFLHEIPYFHLELISPVEELEPYFVMELKGAYGVYNTRFQPETEVCHFFTDMHPHAKAAAEAECKRLNAEHRKDSTLC